MPAFQINVDEIEALRGLPHMARMIYVFGLRPFMDYSTGLVGVKRGVSWKSIAEELYIEPHQGIKGGDPSEKELRRAAVWLEKAGLIGPNQAERRLVFPLLLATRDKSAPNKVGIKWADEAGRPETPSNPNESGAFDQVDPSKAGGYETPKVGTPPLSVKSTSTGNARGAFAMPLTDWEPELKTFKAFAFANSVSANALTPEILAAFRTYWHVRPEREQTQAQWEQQLVSHLKHHIRQAQAGGYTHGSSKANANSKRTRGHGPDGQSGGYQRQDRSAPGRVRAAIAERQQREQAASAAAGQAVVEDVGDVRPPLDVEFRRIS
ncbi:DnaT-like ssDNA-binding domain-containing protein [Pseudomonas sp. DG56-2]|uniref:DnaT-like ssDNA-binding domain-containing protein n=1 Tax=Pseudomonas sp. DG56-2 TaxID=2320270 RepID=UPI0010A5C809|nr:DnaT-like ssDNA-binding domain-containing protein [Pseudomonas sp. DG56-2]